MKLTLAIGFLGFAISGFAQIPRERTTTIQKRYQFNEKREDAKVNCFQKVQDLRETFTEMTHPQAPEFNPDLYLDVAVTKFETQRFHGFTFHFCTIDVTLRNSDYSFKPVRLFYEGKDLTVRVAYEKYEAEFGDNLFMPTGEAKTSQVRRNRWGRRETIQEGIFITGHVLENLRGPVQPE